MTPEAIVNTMLSNDRFSNWLGIRILAVEAGYCKATLTISEEMLNGMQLSHGGITYSLSDSVFAFASNARGNKAVSIETSISHLRPTYVGDQLTAETEEVSFGKRTAIYTVTVTNQDGKKVALFKGTAFRTEEIWQ